MATKEDKSIQKRQQIARANRLMFLWVAGASAIIGAALVLSYVMGTKLFFNERVLSAKSDTVSKLKNNNAIVKKLKENVRVLNTNQSLLQLQTQGDTEPVQVLLDALPSQANSTALGTSLQSNKLLAIPGVTIESLTVSPVAGVEDGSTATIAPAAPATTTATVLGSSQTSKPIAKTIDFTFTVSVSRSDADSLKQVLINLENSIRSTTLNTVQVQEQTNKLIMTVQGSAYYLPAKQVTLYDRTIDPHKKDTK